MTPTSTVQQLSDQAILDARKQFRPTQLSSDRREAMRKAAASQGALTDQQLRAFFSLSELAARHATDEEWIALVREGHLPDMLPVPPAQLEQLKGGFVGFGIAAAVCAMIIIATL